MTKTLRMLTTRSRTSPRWECVFYCMCLLLLNNATWRFVSIPHLCSFCPIHPTSLFSLYHCFYEPSSYHFCSLPNPTFERQLLLTASYKPLLSCYSYCEPTWPFEDITYSPPLQTPIAAPQFCTTDPRPTYLTAESRNPEPHSRAYPLADPTSKHYIMHMSTPFHPLWLLAIFSFIDSSIQQLSSGSTMCWAERWHTLAHEGRQRSHVTEEVNDYQEVIKTSARSSKCHEEYKQTPPYRMSSGRKAPKVLRTG